MTTGKINVEKSKWVNKVIQSMPAGKSINDLKFSKKLHYREKHADSL